MTPTTALQLIVTDVEHQDDQTGHNRGWIVPAGTDPGADLQLEALTHVDIPAIEDETEWMQGLRDALAAEGYAITGAIEQDGRTVTAVVEAV